MNMRMAKSDLLDQGYLNSLVPGSVIASTTLPAVSVTQLVFYCAAAAVTDPIHFDRTAAAAAGFPDLIVNGSLRVAWLAQALAALCTDKGLLEHFKCSHRSPLLVGAAPRIEVRFLKSERTAEGQLRVFCEAETFDGDRSTDIATGTLLLQC